MSHYPGLVIVPSTLSLDQMLAPFNENETAPRHLKATRTQLIEEGRKQIEGYRDSYYAEYLSDPDGYAQDHTADHVKYVAEEFPKRLTWTDDEVHADTTRWDESEDLDADGNLYTTAPPSATWDWWVIGGRWSGAWGPNEYDTVTDALKTFTSALDAAEAYAPRAIVTPDHGWHERGRMGWFGISDDNESAEEWRSTFLSALTAAADTFPSAKAYVVDFHI